MILATLMQALDTTIANVALPYMQGSVSASQDEIDWVLTSYIVAAAIMTPPTGFLAARFGLKRLFLVAITGFTVTSMLCGMAQTLTQIVLFRVMQGAFGAALVPLSQTVLLDAYPRERQGFAMALFGVGVMVGPVLGPVIGGWLTEHYTWRYVFYINLPIGIVALFGMVVFLPDSKRDTGGKLDWFGFGTLSLAVGALQLMLDRGEIKDWFRIPARSLSKRLSRAPPFIFSSSIPSPPTSLSCDRRCSAIATLRPALCSWPWSASPSTPRWRCSPRFCKGSWTIRSRPRGWSWGRAALAPWSPCWLSDDWWRRYPCAARRGPRRHGVVVLCDDWVDAGCLAPETFVGIGLIQGAGLGFLFVPLSAVTLSTLAPEHRTEGASFYNLSRNIGSSAGISIVSALLTHNTQINHAAIAEHVTAVNRAFEDPAVAHFWNPMTAAGRAALDAMVTRRRRSSPTSTTTSS